MLQRDRADPGLQLWTYDEILFPLLMLPAPSRLEAAHPRTAPASPLWGWQLSHCSDTIPLSCSPRASDSRQLKHHHCGRASTLVRTGILQFLEERTCSKVCEPGHGRLVAHVLQMRPVRAADPNVWDQIARLQSGEHSMAFPVTWHQVAWPREVQNQPSIFLSPGQGKQCWTQEMVP